MTIHGFKRKLAFTVALALSVTSTTVARAAETAIRIGVMSDMAGPLASASGAGSVEAARMAAEEFGWSINGRPIEILSGDHQNKPDLGAEIARRWFELNQVDAVADLANSAVGFAVVEVARPRNKVVLISGPGSSDFTGKACAPTSIHWTWDTYAAANGSVRAMSSLSASTWFFITTDFAFGHAIERDATRAIEQLGGKVIGHVRVPFNNADFSSFILQAQQSGASIIALATAGQDTINLVKQASEFGLTRAGARILPMQVMIDEVKAIGLPLGQGIYATMAFHHEQSAEAKAWSQRFFQRMKAMPSQVQAGTYSAVRHYLQAVKDTGAHDQIAIVEKMKATPVNDMFATGGYIRRDGRMVHDMRLVQIKAAAESSDPWDLVKIIKTIPGDEAFRPLSESACPLLQK